MNPPGLFPYDKTVLSLVLRRSFFRKLLHLRIEETSAGKKNPKKIISSVRWRNGGMLHKHRATPTDGRQ